MGYFKPIVYFGVYWPMISSDLVVQVGIKGPLIYPFLLHDIKFLETLCSWSKQIQPIKTLPFGSGCEALRLLGPWYVAEALYGPSIDSPLMISPPEAVINNLCSSFVWPTVSTIYTCSLGGRRDCPLNGCNAGP